MDYYSLIKLERDTNGSSYIGKQFPLEEKGGYAENPYLEADIRRHSIARNRRKIVREMGKSKPKVGLFFKI